MALTSPRFASNARLQAAAENKPWMASGEPNHEAVAILQKALVDLGFPMPRSTKSDGTMDGAWGSETTKTVKDFQKQQGLLGKNGLPDGLVGRDTMTRLDQLLGGGGTPAPPSTVDPKALAETEGKPIAVQWINAALKALVDFETLIARGSIPADGLTVAAFKTNFGWSKLTQADRPKLVQIVKRQFQAVQGKLAMSGAIFKNASEAEARVFFPPPKNRDIPPAFAFFNGDVKFTPRFRPFDAKTRKGFGKFCRAAMVLHETVHTVDAVSGNEDIHVSEFDEPKYTNQTPAQSIHNPSSYATFAQQIHRKLFFFPASQRFGAGRPQD